MSRPARAVACALLMSAIAGCAASRSDDSPTAAVPPAAEPAAQVPVLGPSDFVVQGEASQGGILVGTAPAGTKTLSLDGAIVPFDGDGRFLVGFGRDHGPAATLVATRIDGSVVRKPIVVVPRAWRIEALPIPKGTTPTPEFLKRRAEELRRIAAARALLPESDGWRQRFAWPVTGRISGLFGSQRIYRGEKGSYHSGLDIARPSGTAVAAPADGVVILAADHPFSLEGNLLMIDHGMGLSTAFLHLSRIDVKLGERVRQGQVVGAIGATGRVTGPHLHWSLRWRDEKLDPLLVLGEAAAAVPAG